MADLCLAGSCLADVAAADWAVLIDGVLGLTAIEAAALILWHRRTGRGLPPAAVARLLLPGVFLILALRVALTGPLWPLLPLALLAALIAHLTDLRARMRAADRR